MTSLIDGFEYDIFISYRHNDNRSGWVTEFVKALNEELAATIKDPVSVYFDTNPHDGLLETHNVDKSLEGKLKCLIFIPILSQTYCDPKSFAWQHEFCVFNKLANEDSFGRDIKLSNGNVASRILPIKIHDLDVEDKATIENEIGGVLRAIEFIYKEPGVNRPLKSTDDRILNLVKSDYKNQVNKVANAVKEIIGALKNPAPQKLSTDNYQPITSSPNPKTKLILASSIILTLLLIGYFLYPKLFSSTKDVVLDKSIAVLPFVDMSSGHDQEYFGDGVSEEIINVLVQSEDLKVIARSSSFQFKGKNEDLKKIGQMLGVANILEGSIRKSDDKIRVTAQLINTANGIHLWSKTFDRSVKDIFAVQDEIAKTVAEELKATFKEPVHSAADENWNEEAKKEYQLGRYFFERRAENDMSRSIEHFRKSIQLNSSKAIVHTLLYQSLVNESGSYLTMDSLYYPILKKALELDSTLPEALVFSANRLLYIEKDLANTLQKFEHYLKIAPRHLFVLRNAGRVFSMVGKSEEAIKVGKSAVELDPMQTVSYQLLAQSLASAENYQEAIFYLRKAQELSNVPYINLVICYVLNHEVEKAVQENLKLTGEVREFGEVIIAQEQKNTGKAMLLLDTYIKKNGENYPMGYAQAAAFMGNKDLAFKWLEIRLQRKSSGLSDNILNVKSHPLLKSLRDDPRFKELLKRANFPEN